MPRTIISKVKANPDFLKDAVRLNNLKHKKKKAKYKKICFKITDTQKEALDIMCRRQKTTAVRYLKSVIAKQTVRYKANPVPVSYVTENQLQLFELEPDAKQKTKR